jgi:hypothetical protein
MRTETEGMTSSHPTAILTGITHPYTGGARLIWKQINVLERERIPDLINHNVHRERERERESYRVTFNTPV